MVHIDKRVNDGKTKKIVSPLKSLGNPLCWLHKSKQLSVYDDYSITVLTILSKGVWKETVYKMRHVKRSMEVHWDKQLSQT